MAYPQVAQDFFDMHLPSSVKSLIDLKTLKLEKESFIQDDLSRKYCDVLFSVDIDSSADVPIDKFKFGIRPETENNKKSKQNDRGYIYALLEHQSSNDSLMALRLFKYMLCVCDYHLTQYPKNKQLPLVYPMVFYNGDKPCNMSGNLWDLFVNPTLAKSWWAEDDYQIIDVKNVSDDLLKKRYSGMLQFFLKHIFERDLLKYWQEFAPHLKSIAALNFGHDYIHLMLLYTLTKIDKNDNVELNQLIKNSLTQEQGDKLMISLAEHWMEEGIEKGIAQGKAEGKVEQTEVIAMNMLKQNADLDFISGVTGLSLSHLNKLKQSI